MAIVRLRGQLEKLAGGGCEHLIEGDTVTELLQGLGQDRDPPRDIGRLTLA